MSDTLWRDNLRRLIVMVGAMMAEAEEAAGAYPHNHDFYAAWRERRNDAYAAVTVALTVGEGARFGLRGAHDHWMVLAGIRCSCTGGTAGLLQNWRNAARRKLGEVA